MSLNGEFGRLIQKTRDSWFARFDGVLGFLFLTEKKLIFIGSKFMIDFPLNDIKNIGMKTRLMDVPYLEFQTGELIHNLSFNKGAVSELVQNVRLK